MHLSKEELAICATHLETIRTILVKMQRDINTISERKTELNKKISSYKENIPYLGVFIIKYFFTEQENALAMESSRINSLREKLADDYFVFSQELEKIKFGYISIVPEYVVDFFTWLTQRFINNPSIPSRIPVELWEMNNQIRARENIPINILIEKISSTILSLIERPGYI